MLSIRHTEHFRIESPTIVTIGTFDGVHQGHQKILTRLKELKEERGLTTAVLTFDPHPRKVLFPDQKDLKLLTSVDEKLDLLRHYGVDVAVVYPFSKSFSQMDPAEYISEVLVKNLKVRTLVIGYDHKFGNARKGDINTLRAAAPTYGYEVEEISEHDIDHIAVSSSKIRKALEEGNLAMAREFLGHDYFMSATVIEGKKLGRKLGYPTANLQCEDEEKLIPSTGIYFVEVMVGRSRMHGMMSIGYNPTTDTDNRIKCEVHVLDFEGDLYGKQVRINFLKRIRGEKKFDGLEALRKALDEDKRVCEELLKAC